MFQSDWQDVWINGWREVREYLEVVEEALVDIDSDL